MAEVSSRKLEAMTSPSQTSRIVASGEWKTVEKNLNNLGYTSLQSIIMVFDTGTNEEQAWAICYQAASSLSKVLNAKEDVQVYAFSDCSALSMHKDGSVTVSNSVLNCEIGDEERLAVNEFQLVSCLGYAVYKALDHGLKPDEERNLSDELVLLINQMTSSGEVDVFEQDAEGRTLEFGLADVMESAVRHNGSSPDARFHYKAVCHALVSEAVELVVFLNKIKTSPRSIYQKEETDAEQIAELGKEDWARVWIQVIRELRNGVKLKHVSEGAEIRRPLYEFALTPYEILMDDIRSRRWNLKVVPDESDVADGVKDAHDIILDFIRSRPPLAPAESRKLAPAPESAVTPREQLMKELKQGESITHRLKPIPQQTMQESSKNGSPNAKKLLKADISILLSNELEESDEELDVDDDAFLQQLYRNRLKLIEMEASPRLAPPELPVPPPPPPKKKITPEANLSPLSPLGAPPSDCTETTSPTVPERRHSVTICQSIDAALALVDRSGVSHSTSFTGGDSANSSRHTQSMLIPVKPSRSRFSGRGSMKRFPNLKEYGVRHPLECMSLTVKEVMHIRFVNTKAELETSPLPPHQLEELENGRVCFTCRKTKFSFFGPWSTACKLCKRLVCGRCIFKMRIPTEHFDSVPVYTLSPLSPDEIKEVLLPFESTGSEPGTPLPSRKEGTDFKYLNPPKVVEKLIADKREERKCREKKKSPSPILEAKSSEDMEADEIVRQVLREDEELEEDVFQTDNAGRPVENFGRFKISIQRDEEPIGANSGSDLPMVKLSLKQRLEKARHVLSHDPNKAFRGPLMNVCSDCKSMVCNIIRASRAMLAISQRGRHLHFPETSDRPGVTRHPSHVAFGIQRSKEKTKLRLDLKPVY